MWCYFATDHRQVSQLGGLVDTFCLALDNQERAVLMGMVPPLTDSLTKVPRRG